MIKVRNWVGGVIAALFLGAVLMVALNWELVRIAPVGLGAVAKITCSNLFLSNRTIEDVRQHELTVAGDQSVELDIARDSQGVTAGILGIYSKRAIYREGLGCTLVNGTTEAQLWKQASEFEEARAGWSESDAKASNPEFALSAVPGIEPAAVATAVAAGFAEPADGPPWHTRAIVVFHRDRLIAERYGEGYGRETRQLGWSMTKSVNSALIGILVRQGKLELQAPAPVPEWREPGDPRGAITLAQLMEMRSGLEFAEVYEADLNSDVNRMLFAEYDAAGYAAAKPLAAPAGTRWSYSSGTTNILSRIVRHTVGGSQAEYLSFPQRELFGPIGVASAVMEPDPSGTFVASSYMYATPLDWARLGLLYLHDGVWDGERILPEGWVEYSRTPVMQANSGYGAQFWLNRNGKGELWFPYLPDDMFYMSGHDGQFVVIIPSEQLVVVRMGFSSGVPARRLLAFIGDLIELLPDTR